MLASRVLDIFLVVSEPYYRMSSIKGKGSDHTCGVSTIRKADSDSGWDHVSKHKGLTWLHGRVGKASS